MDIAATLLMCYFGLGAIGAFSAVLSSFFQPPKSPDLPIWRDRALLALWFVFAWPCVLCFAAYMMWSEAGAGDG